jgi:hypothetical protein
LREEKREEEAKEQQEQQEEPEEEEPEEPEEEEQGEEHFVCLTSSDFSVSLSSISIPACSAIYT